ncbi:MAG: hypothetical protein JNM56_29920, partial [Planctomycetia bacterium]|nr:hypothetical protein [Planctomycetia bacterium]
IEIRESPAQAVDGLELMLSADRLETTLKAGGGVEPVKLKLTFTNVGSKPITLNTYSVQAWGANGNFLRVVGPDGKELDRQAQPPAPPAAPRAAQFPELQPGMTWQYTINFPTPLFRLNAAGEYRIRASYNGGEATTPHPTPAFARGSWTGKLESNELVLRVKSAENAAAGQPVNGLQLTLTADQLETTMQADGKNAVPVKLSLVFTNVGDRPIKLDVYDLVWRHLRMDLTGPDAESIGVTRQLVEWSKRAREARDYPTLQPQQRYEANAIITLPGQVAIVDPQAAPGTYYQNFAFRKPGAYRLLLTYACPQVDGNPLAKDSWTGVVASNEVVLMVSPAK